ncbi:MAG: class I tRNA ligase family protein, partial [Trebonia sp.]
TENGRKISKSSGATVDPHDLVGRYGTDAVRWWLLREVSKGADADFTGDRLVARANDELANGFGNLVNRVVTMIHRYRGGHVPDASGSAPASASLAAAIADAPAAIGSALDDFDFRRAAGAVWTIADEANRYVNLARPWILAKSGETEDLGAVLTAALRACQAIGANLVPFLPGAASLITRQCAPDEAGVLLTPAPLLPRLPVDGE